MGAAVGGDYQQLKENFAVQSNDKTFEKYRKRRFLLLLHGMICMLFVVGVPYGYSAIKPVLIHAGVYDYLCEPEERGNKATGCHEQVVALNSMFNVGVAALNIVTIVHGFMVSALGMAAASFLGCVSVFVGYSIFVVALCWFSTVGILFTIGYVLMLSGGSLYMATMCLAQLFGPRWSGFVLTLLLGAWEVSGVVFYIFWPFYYKLNISLELLFGVYGMLCLFIGIVCLLTFPTHLDASKSNFSDSATSSKIEMPSVGMTQVSNNQKTTAQEQQQQQHVTFNDGNEYAMLETKKHAPEDLGHTRAATAPTSWGHIRVQLWRFANHTRGISCEVASNLRRSWPTAVLLQLFEAVNVLVFNFYMANVLEQVIYAATKQIPFSTDRFGDATSLPEGVQSSILTAVNVYAIMFSTVGVVANLIAGLVIVRFGLIIETVMMALLLVMFGLCSNIPNLYIQYGTFVALISYRAFFWAGITKFIYDGESFSSRSAPTIYGLITTVGGFVILLGTPLSRWTIISMHGNFFPVNVSLTSLSLVLTVSFLLWLLRQRYERVRQLFEPSKQHVAESTATNQLETESTE